MNDKNKIYLIPESFQEYQKLPEKIKEIITNYVLSDMLIKIRETSIDNVEDSESIKD